MKNRLCSNHLVYCSSLLKDHGRYQAIVKLNLNRIDGLVTVASFKRMLLFEKSGMQDFSAKVLAESLRMYAHLRKGRLDNSR